MNNSIAAPVVKINDQCKYALNIMEKTSDHIFLTGKAGTGKSTLLNLFRNHTKKNVVVLAPTGIAALNVQGQTIHSFFKFNTNITVESARKKGLKSSKNATFFRAIDTIIIDEISMVRADLFDCIDIFLRAILKNKKPFGGKQVIAIGDLYQLAPVVTTDEQRYFTEVYTSAHFFASHVFEDKEFSMRFIELEKIYRQKDDSFIQILNAIRSGTPTDAHLAILNQRVDHEYTSHEGDIYLTPTNAHAHAINLQKLEHLITSEKTFEADIEGDFNPKLAPADSVLALKVGAQVMFLNNNADNNWANGTIGHVTNFSTEGNLITVKLNNGTLVSVKPYKWTVYKYSYDEETKRLNQGISGSFTQYPLKLAWAITIHKSQGKTFDNVIFDLGRGAFAEGQVYVALSRCRTMDGLILKKPLKKSDIIVNQHVITLLARYQNSSIQSIQDAGLEDKFNIIQAALNKATTLKLEYLRSTGETVEITITPRYVGPMFYNKKSYIGLRGYCSLDQKDKIFELERIVTIE